MPQPRRLCILALLLFASGCASPSSPADPTRAVSGLPLVAALTTRPADLEAKAGAGDSTAQYALALVREHGLRGVARDPEGARQLKATALASRGSTAITQYIAGINGAPGRVHIINMPNAGALGGSVASATEACVAVLRNWEVGGYGGRGRLGAAPRKPRRRAVGNTRRSGGRRSGRRARD